MGMHSGNGRWKSGFECYRQYGIPLNLFLQRCSPPPPSSQTIHDVSSVYRTIQFAGSNAAPVVEDILVAQEPNSIVVNYYYTASSVSIIWTMVIFS
jgi:hypothetical protein